jgi:hypothetical protein
MKRLMESEEVEADEVRERREASVEMMETTKSVVHDDEGDDVGRENEKKTKEMSLSYSNYRMTIHSNPIEEKE